MRPWHEARTVFALSSAPGRSAIAVIRISGPKAGRALEALGGRTDRARVARLVRLCEPGSGVELDEAVTLWFPGPRSETGEDVAELQVHGGPAVVAGVLAALSGMEGLLPAAPGEFARRAFENGKLDLTRVEGLADLIAAETEAQRVQALRQMEGSFGALCDEWRTGMIGALGYLEAGVDFVDEELPDDLVDAARQRISTLRAAIAGHVDDARRGERLRDGFRVVIAGAPNAGKSSLLNSLAGRDAAIVTDRPGTTRDAIDVALDLGGYPVLVTDTAGIRDGADEVEAEGIRRAEARIEEADLVVWLSDASERVVGRPNLANCDKAMEVWSKIDLVQARPTGTAVSVRTGEGLSALIDSIAKRARDSLEGSGSAVITRERHRRALVEAVECLDRALAVEPQRSELVAEELRAAGHALGRVTGRVDVEDVLGAIFGEFCIGK